MERTIKITPKQFSYFEDFKRFYLLKNEENEIFGYEWNSIKETDRTDWDIFQQAIDNIEEMEKYIKYQDKRIENLENLIEKLAK